MSKFTGKIHERIKYLRVSNHLTQKELANILGITEVSMQRFEYGSARPSLDTIVNISNHFNVSVDYILGLSDNPKRY